MARRKKRRPKQQPEQKRAASIQVGTGPGVVAVRFDRPLSSMDLSPKDALSLSIALATAARTANEKLLRGAGLADDQPLQSPS